MRPNAGSFSKLKIRVGNFISRFRASHGSLPTQPWLAPKRLILKSSCDEPSAITFSLDRRMPSNSDSAQPLVGVCVLVTRPAHQAAALTNPLMALGASVLLQPAVEIAPTEDWSAFDSALSKMERLKGSSWSAPMRSHSFSRASRNW